MWGVCSPALVGAHATMLVGPHVCELAHFPCAPRAELQHMSLFFLLDVLKKFSLLSSLHTVVCFPLSTRMTMTCLVWYNGPLPFFNCHYSSLNLSINSAIKPWYSSFGDNNNNNLVLIWTRTLQIAGINCFLLFTLVLSYAYDFNSDYTSYCSSMIWQILNLVRHLTSRFNIIRIADWLCLLNYHASCILMAPKPIFIWSSLLTLLVSEAI